MADRTRVLIVDDSRLFRAALEEALSGQPDIHVVGSVFSGAKAIEFIRNSPPDIVTLDVEMPEMDGVETLLAIQRLGASDPRAAAIGALMVSAYTRRGTESSVRALAAGAFDVVAKPTADTEGSGVARLRDEILPRIRAFMRRRAVATPAAPFQALPRRVPASPRATRCIVIGASTGGPRALCTLLPELCAATKLPILIVQHMPVGFTASLAASLAREANADVVEAADLAPIEAARVYIAPGGRHLVVRGSADAPHMGLNDQPAENGCRPAVDVLFRSSAAVFGAAQLAIILTGMGRDGAAGAAVIRRAGGYVVAQDEATSVVWGMPGSAVADGVVDVVVPLPQIAAVVAGEVRKA